MSSSPKHVTVSEAIDAIGYGKFQLMVFLVGGLAHAADGMEMVLVAFLFLPLKVEWGITETDIGLMASCVFAGMFLGSWSFGVLADMWSRRFAFIIAGLCVSAFGLLSATADSFWALAFLRAGVGFGIGGVSICNCTLQAELCPVDRRGALLCMIGVAWSFGSLVEAFLAWFLLNDAPEDNWRVLVVVTAIFPLISTLLAAWKLPESPRSLAIRNERPEVYALLTEIAAANGSTEALSECMKDSVLEFEVVKEEEYGSVKMLFAPGMRRTTILVWLTWMNMIFVYYGAVFILPQVVNRLSDSEHVNTNVYSLSAIGSAVEISFTILAAGITDLPMFPNFGRKQQIQSFIGTAGLCAAFGALVAARTLDYIITPLMFMKGCMQGTTVLVYTFTAEVYPTSTRAIGLGSSSGMGRFGGLFSPVLSSFLLGFGVRWPFAMFTCVCALGCVIVYCIPTETKGQELTDSVQSTLQHQQDVLAERSPLVSPNKKR